MRSDEPQLIAVTDPRVAAIRRWGVAYAGTGDLEAAARAIEEAFAQEGLAGTRERLADGSLLIEAIQTRPWYRIVLGAAPQRASWHLAAQGRQLEMTVDQRTFGWYDLFLASLCVVAVVCFLFDEISLRHSRLTDPQGLAHSSGFASLFGLACLLACVQGLRAIGGARTDGIRMAVLRAAETDGGALEPVGRPVNRRFATQAMALIGFAAVLAAVYIFCGTNPEPLPSAAWVLLGGLSFLFLVLVAASSAMVRWQELTLRTSGLVLGLISLLTVLFFTAFAGFASLSASMLDARGPETFLDFEHDLRSGAWPPENVRSRVDPAALDRLRRTVTLRHAMARSAARVMLLAMAIALAGSIGCSAWLLTVAARAQETLVRLTRRSARGVYRRASMGGRSLRALRVFFVVVWAGVSVFLLRNLAYGVLFGAAATGGFLPPSDLRIVDFTATLAAFAFDLPHRAAALTYAVRGIWLLYGLVALALPTFSIGELVRSRHRLRRRLAASSEWALEPAARALARLAREAGVADVRPAVSEDSHIAAQAHRFGLLRPRCYVEVTTTALARLEETEIEALLAHEVVHLAKRHCAMDNLLRWLGRLTFVGDGFVRTIQDSFGYETVADAAIREIGAQPEALATCLLKARNLNTVVRLRRRAELSGLPFEGGEPVEIEAALAAAARNPEDRWRLGWKLFVDQYTRGFELHYRHPATDERIAALRGLGMRGNGAATQ